MRSSRLSNDRLTLLAMNDSIEKIQEFLAPFDNAGQKIKDFRNLIAHDYLGINAEEVWQIISKYLLPLKTQIQKLIKLKH